MAYQGKLALITRAGSGMGRLAAQRLAKQGTAVAALDINETGLQETAEGFENIHTFVVGCVRPSEAILKHFSRILRSYWASWG